MTIWPNVHLGSLLHLDLDRVSVDASVTYPMVGVYSFGRGLFQREPVSGANTSYRQFYRLKSHHIVMSQLFGWEGALALSSEDFAGRFVSPQFPTFQCDEGKLDRHFLGWLMRRPSFWNDLGTRASGMGDRRRTLSPESLYACQIHLPPLPEQRRIVAHIEALARKINEARNLRVEIQKEQELLLMAVYHRIAESAPWRALGEVAPLTRRPVSVDPEKEYPQVAVRSFGKGTFHKPPLAGKDVTWQKPFLVKTGDIVISNIKAWEGAIAVAARKDDGRVGSHRYLTCVPRPMIATARFVCFHLLTPQGLYDVGEASPGSADRNRTLSSKALLEIKIPVPSFEQQLWFDDIYQRIEAAKGVAADATTELDALLPSVLDKAFSGEL